MAPTSRHVNMSIDIDCSPASAFTAICDLPGYNKWLCHSGVFKGTTEISDNPIRPGTKYKEQSPSGTRYGEVVHLDESGGHVVFHQPHTLTPAILGIKVDVIVDMVIREREVGLTTLDREVRLGIPTGLGLAAGYIESLFRAESLRMMEQLQVFLEEDEH